MGKAYRNIEVLFWGLNIIFLYLTFAWQIQIILFLNITDKQSQSNVV